ncbi:MAG: threonylcarbamoyl-AMP synthase [Crocinitomicaceae bacterium]|nr:threonylcarbamoyl-AMP synthase [Crocinitomicaceae bacterium]
MLIEINPNNIDRRLITQCVEILKAGGIIIFPTDTVYAMGCNLNNKKALNKLAKLKGVKLKKANFSIICSDLSHLSDYVKHIDRPTYKILNRTLPGPFTFILTATNEIPRLFDTNRKEVGIRIPDNAVITTLVEELGNPIATTSLHDDEDEILDYFIDPYEIYERYDTKVDMIIDGGSGNLEASTVVDCTGSEPEIIRQGAGEIFV